VAKKPIWGEKKHLKLSQKMENKIAKFFETIKLNKKTDAYNIIKTFKLKLLFKILFK